MVTDPIADLLVRIQNAARRGHATVTIPASKMKAEVLRVLKAEGFIQGFEKSTHDGHPALAVTLRYLGEGRPVISSMQRVSTPGCRVYVGHKELKLVRGGMGVTILSTSKGIMTDQESKRSKLGGEVLCRVW
jgi:small subunit ribosomal protein S8